MTSLVRKFWRGQTNERSRMAWLSWDKMCLPKEKGGLGFHDLKAFNLTLLSKQGWHIQTNITPLVHRVFKAWYFPNGDFLSVELGNHLLFAWCSILATQSIVWKGHQWQVRKGHSLNILRDKWLNEPSTFKLTSRLVSVPFDARVSLLTDPYTRAWKAEMITQIFSLLDALTILSIPLSFWLLGDRMTCAYTSKGDFTIRSAYKIALDEVINGNLGEASDNQNRNIFWKTL